MSSDVNATANGKGLATKKVSPANLKHLPLSEILDFDSIVINKLDTHDIDSNIIRSAYNNGLSIFVSGSYLTGQEITDLLGVPALDSSDKDKSVVTRKQQNGEIIMVGTKKAGFIYSRMQATNFGLPINPLDGISQFEKEHATFASKKMAKSGITEGLQIEPTSWDYLDSWPDYYSPYGWVNITRYAKRQVATGSTHTWDIETVISTNPGYSLGSPYGLWTTSHLAVAHNVNYAGQTLIARTPDSVGTPGSSYALTFSSVPSFSWTASGSGLYGIHAVWDGNWVQWDVDYGGDAALYSKDFDCATRSNNTFGNFVVGVSYTVTWQSTYSPSAANSSTTHSSSFADF